MYAYLLPSEIKNHNLSLSISVCEIIHITSRNTCAHTDRESWTQTKLNVEENNFTNAVVVCGESVSSLTLTRKASLRVNTPTVLTHTKQRTAFINICLKIYKKLCAKQVSVHQGRQFECGKQGQMGGGVYIWKSRLHAKQSFVFLLNYNCRGGGGQIRLNWSLNRWIICKKRLVTEAPLWLKYLTDTS